MAAALKQDMPPKGGYPGIVYTKNIPKGGPSGLVIMLGGVAAMAIGFYGMKQTNKKRRENTKYQLRARLALLPLLQAEEDRRILRAMRAFEEEETKIMKDVPGWTPGESVYHTNKWLPPHPALLKDFEK